LMCLETPGCEVNSVLATVVRLKFWRTVSRRMRSCWKFMSVRRRVFENDAP